jgi:hypothetical protein
MRESVLRGLALLMLLTPLEARAQAGPELDRILREGGPRAGERIAILAAREGMQPQVRAEVEARLERADSPSQYFSLLSGLLAIHARVDLPNRPLVSRLEAGLRSGDFRRNTILLVLPLASEEVVASLAGTLAELMRDGSSPEEVHSYARALRLAGAAGRMELGLLAADTSASDGVRSIAAHYVANWDRIGGRALRWSCPLKVDT